MKKAKSVKTRLIASCLALLMMLSALVGTTFAWFTDSVTSSGNKIVSGTLKVDLELYDTETKTWNSIKASKAPIFNYDNWEPGYTDVKLLKVENEGSLALKWKAKFVSDVALSELANVIDVYVCPSKTELTYPADRSLNGYKKVGTVAEFVNTIEETTYGNLLAGEVAYLGIALKMQESAGNEYQNKALGAFDIQIVATQMAYEGDSFGPDYDNGALYPLTPGKLYSATAAVTANAEGKVDSDVTIGNAGDKGNATVPAGVLLEQGTKELTLDLSVVSDYEAVISAKGGDVIYPLDIHVAGVSKDNTVPVIVTLNDVFPKNYMSYNIKLVHVENGASVAMTPVDTLAELDAHNEFYYDPATGSVTVAMATFSEVTATVAAGNPWDGEKVDTSWYNTTATEFTLTTADQLAGFAQIVGGMAEGIDRDSFKDKIVKLGADVNLGSTTGTEEKPVIFTPVGYYFTNDKNGNGVASESKDDVYSDVFSFEGTFDGQGHVVSNILQRTWDIKGDDKWYNVPAEQYYNDGMGLFGFVYNGTVKNLTVDNFQSDGEFCTTGCVAAYASGSSNFTNITVINSNPRAYNVPNGGVVGYAYAEAEADANVINFTDVKVDNSNKISALWGTYDAGCGGILGRVNGATIVNMTNCEVGAVLDVFNDVCGNYQYYQYRYSGMLIGTVGGDSDPLTGDEKVNFSNVNVYVGDWADYYYCEFEKNSGASYTEDFQFSRVERDEIVFDANNMPTSCTHTHTANEDKMALYLPFNQLYTGYGWGSSPQRTAEGVTVTRYFYMITYLNADGTLIEVEYVTDGQRDETHNIANEKAITKTHTAEGKTFDGWVNLASQKVNSIAAGNRKDVTLYATYANVYTARYMDENGDVIQTLEFTKNTNGLNQLKAVAVPETTSDFFVKGTGYWSVSNGTGSSIALNDLTVSDISSDITLYASYELNISGDASITLQGVDADGDGKIDYYAVNTAKEDDSNVNIVIPDYINGLPVAEIIDGAFAEFDNITTVKIPVTITKLGADAFANKENSGFLGALKYEQMTFLYEGTYEQWQAITKDDNWDRYVGQGSRIYFLADGTYSEETARNGNWSEADRVWSDPVAGTYGG